MCGCSGEICAFLYLVVPTRHSSAHVCIMYLHVSACVWMYMCEYRVRQMSVCLYLWWCVVSNRIISPGIVLQDDILYVRIFIVVVVEYSRPSQWPVSEKSMAIRDEFLILFYHLFGVV